MVSKLPGVETFIVILSLAGAFVLLIAGVVVLSLGGVVVLSLVLIFRASKNWLTQLYLAISPDCNTFLIFVDLKIIEINRVDLKLLALTMLVCHLLLKI